MEDILFEKRGRAGVVTLNKSETLNAVTDAMLTALNKQLDIWENDAAIERIIIKAVPGRAFSAGGDIRHLYERGIAGDYDFDFFAREYALNVRIANLPKPYISLVDGIAMGGGVGVSFHGWVIVGDNVSFAMPEVGIGFFPDVGASRILNQAGREVALYLGLTGARLGPTECMAANLAGLYVPSGELSELEAALCTATNPFETITDFQLRHTDLQFDQDNSVDQHRVRIEKMFSAGSVAEIVERLEKASGEADGEWAIKTLKQLGSKSPTSLEIAFRQLTRADAMRKKLDTVPIEEAMRMEYRILRRILEGPDFYEGIRAAIIDKDNTPRWQPATLDAIDPQAIEAYFEPLGELELQL